ncbi:Aldo/keto reductase [Daedalea quercina L-15889]|uniref:Aldo/keto reductase n=1 Tax=Daedalea quercina L-15889 TaxID=1314783 RepID=A0A165QXM4_9APHY|nr:Aldo/keto reductase [Daedalea quercina L-15889]
MPASQYVTLNTGAKMPTLGLGTWKSAPGAVEKAVEVALTNGYRHIDTAQAYANEKEVGEGIKRSGVPREEIFLTTKLNNTEHADPLAGLQKSLVALDTPYLDLWLMHWPCPMKAGGPDRSLNWLDTWKGMEAVFRAHPDKVRAIGVSNISAPYLEELLAVASVVPAVNQLESHPSLTQEELVQLCRSKGIVVTAYSPLGSDNAPLGEHPVVKEIAAAHGVTPHNILVSLHANRPGVNVIPKSVTPARIIANKTIVDLSPEEVQKLFDIEKAGSKRVCKPFWTGYGDIGFADCKQ